MTDAWTHQLAQALAAGRLTVSLLEAHLDRLLLWLGNPDNPRAAALDQAFRRVGLSREQAADRAYQRLDQWLFANPDQPAPRTLGLPADAAPDLTKQRYRHLILAYHPDRHLRASHWATQRTERINRAFNAQRRGKDGWITPPAETTETATGHATSRFRQTAWRRRLPDAIQDAVTRFQCWSWTQRVGLALSVIGVISILLHLERHNAPRIIVTAPTTIRTLTNATPAAVAETPSPPVNRPEPVVAAQTAPALPAPVIVTAVIPADAPVASAAHPDISQDEPAAKPETSMTPADSVAQDSASPAPTPSAEPAPLLPPAMSSSAQLPPVLANPLPETVPPRLAPPESVIQTPAMQIPSPTPPAPPERPTLASTTPVNVPKAAALVNPEITPNNTAKLLDCNPVAQRLNTFQQAYNAGAINELMALYSPESRENDLVNWLSIRHTYADWFRKTSARRIAFEQLHVQPTADQDRCAAIAVFQVSYLDSQAKLVTQAGVIKFLFEQRGADWYILRVRY